MAESRIGKTERVERAVFECPECRDAEDYTPLSTDDALARDELPNGLRFRGIQCPTCGKSYTVEMLNTAPTHAVDVDIESVD